MPNRIHKDHIFSNGDSTFVRGVLRMTGGRGVDVCISALAGEGRAQSFECIAPLGRFIELGKKDLLLNRPIKLHPFQKNIAFVALDIIEVYELRPQLKRQLLEQTVSLWGQGKLKPAQPLSILNISDIAQGMRELQSGRSAGKTVFECHPESLVPVAPAIDTPYQFGSSVSYVLAGGLGGIGRSIAEWMASRGARNLIFLSRSGASTDATMTTLSRLRRMGCHVKVCICDITVESQIRAALSECEEQMPPIKGCIQCSMVLKDGPFGNMSIDEWSAATKPKIQGSCNLHTILPRNLDFFIMLSSVFGVIGNRGQANYAAANTYQDALARFRISQGYRGVSLDLAAVKSVGVIAENELWQADGTVHPLLSSSTFGEAVDAVLDSILKKLSTLLVVREDEIDVKKTLRDNGIDSLMLMGLSKWFIKELAAKVNLVDSLARDDLVELSRKVATASKLVRVSIE